MNGKMNVVLDLDNTLLETVPNALFNTFPQGFINKFNVVDFPDIQAKVVLRPGLRSFLDYLFDNFNVSVFTAAEKDYSKFIRDNIVAPDNSYTYNGTPKILYKALDGRHNVFSLQKYGKFKDLRIMKDFNIPDIASCNTLLIDDLDDVQAANPNNVIRILPFKLLTSGGKKCNAAMIDDGDLRRVAKEIDKRYDLFLETGCVYDPEFAIPNSCSAV
jgi:TFIIF-interacting CTD phosphatase-like protein